MLKIILEIEEKEENTQVTMKNQNFEKATKNEQMSALQIIDHLRKLFNEVDATKKEEKKKTSRKKKGE